MKKLLIVEDDQNLVQTYLQKFIGKVDLKIVDNGEDALKVADEWHPDVILLDIILRGKESGFSVLQDLKANEKTKSIPVVVLTNLENQEDSAKAMGSTEYLEKAKIDLDSLVTKILQYTNG